MEKLVIYRRRGVRGSSPFIIFAESALWGLLFFAIWYKFHCLNLVVSSRHSLTAETFFGSMGVVVCLAAPLLLLPPRLRCAALVLFNLALSLLVLTDLLYLRYYSDLFSIRNIGLSAQADDVADSIIALMRFRDIMYFIDIPVFAVSAWLMARRAELPRLSFLRFAALCLLFAAGISCVTWKMTHYNAGVSGALRAMWDRPAVAAGCRRGASQAGHRCWLTASRRRPSIPFYAGCW